MSRSKNWCFTAFGEDNPAIWQCSMETTYICWGEETCPETGKLHYQGYMELPKRMTFSALKAALKAATGGERIHLETRKGTAAQAVDYCAKRGKYQKDGKDGLPNEVFVEFGSVSVQGKRTDLQAAAVRLRDGTSLKSVAEEDPALYVKYYKGLQALAQHYVEPCNWVKEVICLYGLTGTGKTRTAVSECEGQSMAFVEIGNGFVTGYNGETNVIIDDFEDKMCSRNMFLRLTDRYPYKANVKGGHVEWAPRRIFITTNFRPEDLYEGDPAIQRRISEKRELVGTYESRQPVVNVAEEDMPDSPRHMCWVCGVVEVELIDQPCDTCVDDLDNGINPQDKRAARPYFEEDDREKIKKLRVEIPSPEGV